MWEVVKCVIHRRENAFGFYYDQRGPRFNYSSSPRVSVVILYKSENLKLLQATTQDSRNFKIMAERVTSIPEGILFHFPFFASHFSFFLHFFDIGVF